MRHTREARTVQIVWLDRGVPLRPGRESSPLVIGVAEDAGEETIAFWQREAAERGVRA